MMQKVVEEHGAYKHKDSAHITKSGKDHCPAYGSEGDYFSNPSSEDVIEGIYDLMAECYPQKFPSIH